MAETHQQDSLLNSLLASRDELAQALRRVRAFLPDGVFRLLVEWVGYLRIARGRSPLTCRRYLDVVGGFLHWLDGQTLNLDSVNTGILDRWHQWRYLECGIGSSTRSGDLSAVRQFFAWRERMGGRPSPIRDFPGPTRSQRVPRRFTTGQLQRLLGACDRSTTIGRRDYALVLFFLATGARRAEVASLDLNALQLRERVGVVRFYGKGTRERVVPFEGPVIDAMRQWLADRDGLAVVDRDAVFLSLSNHPKGHRLSRRGLNGVLARLIKHSRLNVAPGMALHTLRSTYATALYDHKFDLEEIRILLGHSSILTTRHYIALSNRQMKVRLPAAFFSAITSSRPGVSHSTWGSA